MSMVLIKYTWSTLTSSCAEHEAGTLTRPKPVKKQILDWAKKVKLAWKTMVSSQMVKEDPKKAAMMFMHFLTIKLMINR